MERFEVDAGIVERVHHRNEPSGRFTSTTFRVDLAADGITGVAMSQGTLEAPAVTDQPVNDSRPPVDQLSLLT